MSVKKDGKSSNGAAVAKIGKYNLYPKATSRVIMTANPPMAPMVAMSVFFSNWDSGISSSTTTYIIAPAAKARA